MRHHELTVATFTERQAARPEVLGVVVVGSVARGDERADSDVDVYLVLTDEAYAAAERSGEVAFVSLDEAAYAGGYVDVKLASPGYLAAALDHGDDPTRASFASARVTLDRVGDLAALVAAMGDRPDEVWAERVRAYRAQLALYARYFLVQGYEHGDRFLLRHAAGHAALAAGRCALAQHRRLFRGPKYLAGDVAALPELPAGFLEAWETVVDEPTPETARTLVAVVDAWLGQPLTVDDALSRFVADNELAWLRGTIPPEFC